MRLGIIGMGSIGRRHVRSLNEIGINDIIALRTGKGSIQKLPSEFSNIHECWDSNEFYSLLPQGIIVANPTSLHLGAIKDALKHGLPVFVEKPLIDDIKDINEIRTELRSLVMVGFSLRFHPVIKKVYEVIKSGQLKRLYCGYLYCGQYLPFWHPYAEYSKEYYSRKDLGGGALRTLSHEIDLVSFFFEEIVDVVASVEKISNLNIDVDDNVALLLKTSRGAVITIGLDYLNPKLVRKGMIIGENGSIEYTFNPPKVIFYGIHGMKRRWEFGKNGSDEKMVTDEMYQNQMREFCSFVRGEKEPSVGFKDGFHVLKIINAAEESVRSRSWVRLKP